MSCYISSGVALGCSDSIGSLKKIYIVGGPGSANGGITGVTYNASGEITGSQIASGTTIYGFEIKRNTSSLTQNFTKSFENGTGYYEMVLTAVFYKYQADLRNQVKILGQNDELEIIAVDQNDTQYYLGLTNGMYLSAGAGTTGTALGDLNGWSLTFTGQEPQPAPIISGSLATVFSGATISG